MEYNKRITISREGREGSTQAGAAFYGKMMLSILRTIGRREREREREKRREGERGERKGERGERKGERGDRSRSKELEPKKQKKFTHNPATQIMIKLYLIPVTNMYNHSQHVPITGRHNFLTQMDTHSKYYWQP